MALIIDGVFLQDGYRESARMWQALLPFLVRKLDMPVVLLDRGGQCKEMAGVEVVPYPTFKAKFSAHDSALLQRVCTHYGARAFMSSHFTTPLQTPSALIVGDLTAEKMGINPFTREQQENETAIAHARRHICTSNQTRDDLLALYPELDPGTTQFAYCGVNAETFKPASDQKVTAFRSRYELKRTYFVVATRGKHRGGGAIATFPSDTVLAAAREAGCDVLCFDSDVNPSVTAVLDKGRGMLRLAMNDEDLATAYSGAAGLIYPTVYEGFGFPIAEALACGCPVVALSSNGTLAEVALNAALDVTGSSADELRKAMNSVLDRSTRARLSQAGIRQAALFQWEPMANLLVQALDEIFTEDRAGLYRSFYEKWALLRSIQGEVDVVS